MKNAAPNVIYLETSAILAWLFGQPGYERIGRVLEDCERVITSGLTLLEGRRSLCRANLQGLIKDAQAKAAEGVLLSQSAAWEIMEITSTIRERASQPFPREPIRSLDAIHLATACEFMKVYSEIAVLSLDQRILENLEPLGLSSL